MDFSLEPISSASPCGEDLSYDTIYNELGVLIEGTPEDPFTKTPAKEPSWPKIRQLCEDALKRSMDLQIAVYYTVTLLRLDGLSGAAEGLELISGMVRGYWDGLYPELDSSLEEGARQLRVSIIEQMSAQPGGDRDPIKFIERLGAAPLLTGAKKMGVVPLGYLSQRVATKEGAFVTGASQIGEIVADLPASEAPGKVANAVATLKRIAAAVHSIDDFLISQLGVGQSANLSRLISFIDRALQAFEQGGASAGPPLAAAAEPKPSSAVAVPAMPGSAIVGQAPAPAPAVAAAAPGFSDAIRSTADVARLLDRMCEFYRATEPSSPVPHLLRRARRLIGKDFFALIEDLAPGGRDEFMRVAGPDGEAKTEENVAN